MASRVTYLAAGMEDGCDDLSDVIEPFERTLKISVAPDKTKGACLNGKDFNASISSELEVMIESVIQDFDTYHNQPVIKNQLRNMLANSSEPHNLALKLYLKCPQTHKKSLAQCVLDAIKELNRQKPNIINALDDDTRMAAFNFFKFSAARIIQIVAHTYDLRRIAYLIIPKLKDIIQNGDYVVATHWIIYLNIQREFGILDIIFPLVLQKSTTMIFYYLNATPTLQIPTAQFLDSLLDRKITPIQKSFQHVDVYDYKNVSLAILQSTKSLLKLLTLICKRYRITENFVPNQTFLHALSYFRHLFQEYLQGNISVDAFKELIIETANTKPLQLAFIEDITDAEHFDEALYWSEQFKIPIDEWPSTVKNEKIKYSNTAGSKHRPFLPHLHRQQNMKRDKYLKLNIEKENIIYVDNDNDFNYMIRYLRSQVIVGFDSEWKPVWNNSDKNSIALLQFATKETIFLIDCLVKNINPDLWKNLERQVFNNKDILKLGFGISHDMKMLSSTLPLRFNPMLKAGYLDLMDLYRYLKNLNIVFPYDSNNIKLGGLNRLAYVCLGKPLDKTNQLSNWSRRPLRHEQFVYAALDAYCLIQIYDVIENLLQKKQMDINEIIEDINNGNRKINRPDNQNDNTNSKVSSTTKNRKRKGKRN